MAQIYSMRFGKFERGLKDLISKEISSEDTIIEIGSFMGESTFMFAMQAKQVFAIDCWDKLEDNSQLIVGHTNPNELNTDMKLVESVFDRKTKPIVTVQKIKAFDYEVIDKFKDESVDFIYIDSIHTEEEVSRIIKLWLPKIKKTGKIAGHDYVKYFPGVMKAVDDNFTSVRTYEDTSWVTEVTNWKSH
jgi:predicted O-methyltransferase YrrM